MNSDNSELMEKMRQFDEQMKIENEKLRHQIDDDRQKNDLKKYEIDTKNKTERQKIKQSNNKQTKK